MRSLAYASPWVSAQALGHVAEDIDQLHKTALTVKAGDLDRLAAAVPFPNREADPTVGEPLDRVAGRVGGARSEIAVRGDILFKEVNQGRCLANREELRRRTLALVRRETHDLANARVGKRLERTITAGRVNVGLERILIGIATGRRVGALADGEVRETALSNSLVRGHFVFRWGLAPVCVLSYYNRPSGNRQGVSVAFFAARSSTVPAPLP